ncbi:MAG TPA: cation diffusion facilitator family transporter [Gemmatimonadales bacterium]
MSEGARRGMRTAQVGMLVNAALAAIKLLAGVLGSSYALIADGVESTADIFSSLIVWGGLRIASRSADDDYPFGYGKAEPIAAAVVGLMLIAAAIGIAIESVREIRVPHHAPAPFTLAVLVGVVLVKEVLYRRVFRVGADVGSTAVKADAWHHRSDALTSAAAFVGISIALIGGPGWEPADDWAALLASTIIAYNGIAALRPAVADLMDRAPGEAMLARVSAAATGVHGVCAIEKLKVRKAGLGYWVDLHVQADPRLPLEEAHVLSGMVKSAIRQAVPEVAGALIHMEPYDNSAS